MHYGNTQTQTETWDLCAGCWQTLRGREPCPKSSKAQTKGKRGISSTGKGRDLPKVSQKVRGTTWPLRLLSQLTLLPRAMNTVTS